MAETSVIEQITGAVVAALETLKHEGEFKVVGRDLPNVAGPEWMANLELPALIVTSGLPQFVDDSGHRGIGKEIFLSQFRLQFVVIDTINVGMGARINSLADELWRVCLADQTWGGLAVGTKLAFDEMPLFKPPNVWFGTSLTVTYRHLKGGI